MLQTDLVKARDDGAKDLLIALHGLGDSMEGYRWVPQVLQMPSVNVLLVNAPDAYYGGFSWYDFAADPGPGVERSFQALAMLLDDCRAKGFPTSRTVLLGFSQGCLMTIETGIRYSNRLAGCVGISGYVHEPERLIRKKSPVAIDQKFLITHGTKDPLIPLEKVRPQIDRLKSSRFNIDFVEYEKEHTIIEPEIERIRHFLRTVLA